MKETTVGEMMTVDPVTIHPDARVTEVAILMVEKEIGGLPVVDDEGTLIGIITRGDLIVQDAQVHFPTFVHFLDSYIFVPGSVKKFERELKKAAGSSARDLMTEDVVSVRSDMSVGEVATLMHDKDLKRLPVVDGGDLVGIITRADIVRLIGEGPPTRGSGEPSS